MTTPTPNLLFEVLIATNFASINSDPTISPTNNKHVLSAINDFENGVWRYDKFQNFIWDNIAETALSAKERASLPDRQFTSLTEAAKSLRLTDTPDDHTKGSELAEIMLYGIMKHYYGALPVVPKIFYKQNVNDFAKGADSVHIVISGTDFSLWFGEAKFYNSIADARLDKIIESVEESLLVEKLKKENSIITGVKDLDQLVTDPTIRQNIYKCLNPDTSIDVIKPRLHIPILLLHECAITQQHTILSEKYKTCIKNYHLERAHSYFRKQVAKLGTTIKQYPVISFHLILFPVPSKKTIVEKFLENATLFRNQQP
jgi:hypothetical protein